MKLVLPNFQPKNDLKVEKIDYSQVMKETHEERVSTPPSWKAKKYEVFSTSKFLLYSGVGVFVSSLAAAVSVLFFFVLRSV